MQPKYCRYCNALVQPPEPGVAAPDFCNDEHRHQYQDKIHRETIERLRRAERSSGGASKAGAAAVLTQSPPAPSAPAAKPAAVETTLASLSQTLPPVTKTDKDSLASLLRSARTKIAEKKSDGIAAPSPTVAPPAGQSDEASGLPAQIQRVRVASPGEDIGKPAPERVAPEIESRTAIPIQRVEESQAALPVEKEIAEPAAAPAPRKSPPSVAAPPIRAPHVLQQSEGPAGPKKPSAQPPARKAPDSKPPAAESKRNEPTVPVESSVTEMPLLGASVGVGGGWMMRAAAAVVLIAAGGGYYFWQGGSAAATAKPKRPVVAPILMSPVGWSNTPASSKEDRAAGRILTLYRPSLELSDYRVNLTGEIEYRALGWVFRVKDPSNYYAAKLARIPGGELKLVRWTVADGVASAQVTAPVGVPVPSNGKYKIQLEARGPRFAIHIQGQQIDSWTDTKFASGGFGLANENTERAKVSEVQIGVFGSGH
jgi:hypothetical protein